MSSNKRINTREEAKNIILDSLDNGLDVTAMANDILARRNCFCGATSGVTVKNLSTTTEYEVSITKTCDYGSDDNFTILSGEQERWSRCVYREITIELFGGNSLTHTVGALTGSNYFEINAGELVQR